MTQDFKIAIGNGFYMDSDGTVTAGPQPKAPTYNPPGNWKLPVEPSTVAKALTDISKFLPDKSDAKSMEKWKELLVDSSMIDMLAGLGKFAASLASIVPWVGAAVAVIKLLPIFTDGPSPLEQLLVKRFDELKKIDLAISDQINSLQIDQYRGQFVNASAAMEDYISFISNPWYPPSEQDLRDKLAKMEVNHTMESQALSQLLVTNFKTLADPNKYSQILPLVIQRLYTFPPGLAPTPMRFPQAGDPLFDYKLVLPVALSFLETYCMQLKAILPEFRSTQSYQHELLGLARAIDQLAISLITTSIARTIYKASDFSSISFNNLEVDDPLPGLIPPRIKSTCRRFVVGAYDLSTYTDLAFGDPKYVAGASLAIYSGPTKKMGIDIGWIPPATLEKLLPVGDVEVYRITNAQDCADAANIQSEQDYLDALLASGYMSLMHYAALLRHMASSPPVSETVSGSVKVEHAALDTEQVEVQSEPTLLAKPIHASAQRHTQKIRIRSTFYTQPVARLEKLSYRLMLRTLQGLPLLPDWTEIPYEQYYKTRYEDSTDESTSGLKVLRAETSKTLMVGEYQICDWRTSSTPNESNVITATLPAITFDWWIPSKIGKILGVVDPLSPEVSGKLMRLRALGWNNTVMPLESSGALDLVTENARRLVGASDLIQYEADTEVLNGEHRLIETQNVQIEVDYRLEGDWYAVNLTPRASDRNYTVYLVVEERLKDGNVLHSAKRIPVNGQLTYVPQSFFDQEAAAAARLDQFFKDLIARYSESTQPTPSDPIIKAVQNAGLPTVESYRKILDVAKQVRPDIVKQLASEYGVTLS